MASSLDYAALSAIVYNDIKGPLNVLHLFLRAGQNSPSTRTALPAPSQVSMHAHTVMALTSSLPTKARIRTMRGRPCKTSCLATQPQ